MTVAVQSERECLFEPLTIRGVTLPNRIVMSPMTRGFSPDGIPTDQVADYYERRAAGQAGLIITEGVAVDHPAALGDAGLGEDNIPLLAGDGPMAGWRKVVDKVHAQGGKSCRSSGTRACCASPEPAPIPMSAV